MNQNELARLAYFAGAAAAFSGLHQHEELCESENIDDEEAQAIMQKFALEPFEFLHKYGIQVTK
jgi:hypothetical protein